MTGWTRVAAAAALAAVVVLSGCGGGDGDDGADDAAEEASSTTEAETTTTTSTTEATTTEAPTTEATTTEAPTTQAPTGSGTTGPRPWQDLTAGDCVATLPEGEFTEVTVTDCAQPHAAEALTGIRAVTIAAGSDAETSAQATCDEALTPYAGPGRAAVPIVETQGTLLARAVCLVVDASGAQQTGSVVAG